ncbi:MAG: exodeoxyribonuclease VII large subunit [Nitrospira sp.]|nr:exodeoxyribonuclease VII large subunit [Nitrospira sp.]
MIRASLEADFPEIWLEGEISNLRAPGSGHLYCTLKDGSSQIRAVIFRSAAMRLRFGLEDGLQVVVRGRLSVYEPRGEYQLVLDHLEPKGQGALQLAFEQLKRRLQTEGLFNVQRKRLLPAFPWTVGIVTSPTGAAVRDLLTVLHRRCPVLRIIVAPVQVQGAGAGEQIAGAIHALNTLGGIDVMIVGRGGGSIEDLWSFNEEVVVRAIAGSRIPIVSAVGHETDVTLADFAADVRAPTPSAAGEMVAPVLAEIVERLEMFAARCRQATMSQCLDHQQQLDLLVAHLASIRLRILREAQRVDGALVSMREAIRATLRQMTAQTQGWKQALEAASPEVRVRYGMALVPQLRLRLTGTMTHDLTRYEQRIHAYLARLHSLSPLAILTRGYGMLETMPDRTTIRRVAQVSIGDTIRARLVDGELRCTVEDVVTDSSV